MRKIDPNDFKIRCSAIGQVMTGTIGLTEKQDETLNDLKCKFKLTAKQTDTLQDLEHKRDNPTLPQTLKTYCETWVREKLYGRRKQIFTKQTEKGLICEDQSIEYISEELGLGMVFKNTERKDNDFLTGEADLVLNDEVIDIKNSWDFTTFPLFTSKIDSGYELQLQGYMHLYNKPKARLVYTLMSLPEDLMLSEIFYAEKFGVEEDEVRELHTYNPNELGQSLTIKIFDVEYDPNVIREVKNRVALCRKYISELLSKIN